MKRQKRFSRGLVLALLALALTPSLATAQNAVLYEVTENMKLSKNHGRVQRGATAALMGWVGPGTSICPTWLLEKLGKPGCGITALASNSINVANGKGPVSGTFKIVIQGDNPVDGPELVIASGTLRGHMQLRPPLAGIDGTWSAVGDASGPLAGLRTGGTLSGAFRLPFVVGMPDGCLDHSPIDCVFVSKPSYLVNGNLVDIDPATEYSLGVPTVRVELSFVEQAQSSNDD